MHYIYTETCNTYKHTNMPLLHAQLAVNMHTISTYCVSSFHILIGLSVSVRVRRFEWPQIASEGSNRVAPWHYCRESEDKVAYLLCSHWYHWGGSGAFLQTLQQHSGCLKSMTVVFTLHDVLSTLFLTRSNANAHRRPRRCGQSKATQSCRQVLDTSESLNNRRDVAKHQRNRPLPISLTCAECYTHPASHVRIGLLIGDSGTWFVNACLLVYARTSHCTILKSFAALSLHAPYFRILRK